MNKPSVGYRWFLEGLKAVSVAQGPVVEKLSLEGFMCPRGCPCPCPVLWHSINSVKGGAYLVEYVSINYFSHIKIINLLVYREQIFKNL